MIKFESRLINNRCMLKIGKFVGDVIVACLDGVLWKVKKGGHL